MPRKYSKRALIVTNQNGKSRSITCELKAEDWNFFDQLAKNADITKGELLRRLVLNHNETWKSFYRFMDRNGMGKAA